MRVYYECASGQIPKRQEELCGDSVIFSWHSDWLMMVLSDGLGSGVKANILATLTSRMVKTMLENEIPLGEVVRTVSETLPVCRVRKLAYSTFSVAQLFSSGEGRLVEFDSPEAFCFRDRKPQGLAWESRDVARKNVRECKLDLRVGDWLVFVSDGVISAGIGGIYPLGWGWDQAAAYIGNHIGQNTTANELVDSVLEAVRNLYAGPPGDDVTVAAVKVRRKRLLTLLFGPPLKCEDDPVVVDLLMKSTGRRVVCGGTTASIVARALDKQIDVDLATMTEDTPPLGSIEGLDLVTEGILTMTRLVAMLAENKTAETQKYAVDAASALLRMLDESDSIQILVGQAKNPAHQDPNLPVEIKTELARELQAGLLKRNKECSIDYF